MITDQYADELIAWREALKHRKIFEKLLNEQMGRLQTLVNQANKQPGLDSSISSQARMFAIAELKSIIGLFDFYESEIKEKIK